MDRKQPPIIKNAADFKIVLPDCKHFQLDNKIPVYYIPSNQQETLQLQWIFKAGSWYESTTSIALSANKLLKSGTVDLSALEIEEEIEYYGAFLSLRCYHEIASITLHCLEKQLPHLLPLIRTILTGATYPKEEIALFKKNKNQALSVNTKKSEFVANQLIDTYLFGSYHPYGRHSSHEAYDALQRENILAFFQQYYAHNHCRIFAAGKLSKTFEQQLNQYFGDAWNEKKSLLQKKYPIQPALEKKHRKNITNSEGVQGAVRIATPFPNRYHPDVPKLQILNTIFGGYFGSRLMSNIREDKGYTYGIYSSLNLFAKGGSLMIQTEAGTDICENVVEEVFKEMDRLKQERVQESELHLVRNYIMGSMLGALDGCFKAIRYWKNLIISDLDEKHFYHSIDTIKHIQADEIQELAQKYLDEEQFYNLIVT
ncbi:MAG TPA: pitrilysin family protein [Chitinophagaceae bacterium]|nr:pitrilysin family protein [Chitinophagaceae bacterium]